MTLTRLTQLDDMRVVGEDDSAIGRVFEIRSPGAAETEPTHDARDVDCLLVGRRGLLERLGWKQAAPRAIPWRDVRAIDARTVHVRGTVDDYKLLEAT